MKGPGKNSWQVIGGGKGEPGKKIPHKTILRPNRAKAVSPSKKERPECSFYTNKEVD